MEDFENYLVQEGKSQNTINSYILNVRQYYNWFKDSFGKERCRLYRQNILEFRSYLHNIKKLTGKSINTKLAALLKYNEFLQYKGIQQEIVLTKKDNIKIQQQYASPATIDLKQVENFRQRILENGNVRDYALVTLLAYGGLRISEALNLQVADIDLISGEIRVRNGKGNKERLVYMNDKIKNALKEYLKGRKKISDYIFVSIRGNRLDRTVVNKLFRRYSSNITPHKLRHFFCSHALECGYSIHELANQAGHSNIHTTLLYSNPTREKMKEKANLL